MQRRKRGRGLTGSAPEMLIAVLARAEAARDRYRTEAGDPDLPASRRRLAALHLQVLQRHLALLHAASAE